MYFPSVLFNSEFWLNLRRQTSVNGTFGHELCDVWCDELRGLLYDEELEGFVTKVTQFDSLMLQRLSIPKHCWLELISEITPARRFIADGTAGQIHAVYREGFYGFLETASKRLQDVYDC